MACCICGCSAHPGNQTAAAMKASLVAEIPVGTPVASAENKLRARGFKVSRETNAKWSSATQPTDYLYGEMSDGNIVQRRWQVAVFYRHDAVTGIDVRTGLVGP